MELPPYRMPTLRNTLIHMWEKAVFYLRKMSTVILVGSIVVWALATFRRKTPPPARWITAYGRWSRMQRSLRSSVTPHSASLIMSGKGAN